MEGGGGGAEGEYSPVITPIIPSHLKHSSQIGDAYLHGVRAIPKLPQTICLLLFQSIAMVLVHLSAVIERNLNLGVIMLSQCVCTT